MQILRNNVEDFPLLFARLRTGECTYEHVGEHFPLGQLPSQNVVNASDVLSLLDILNLSDWPEPVPFTCPLISKCKMKFETIDEYHYHYSEKNSSSHEISDRQIIAGFDPLSVTLHQISNFLCDYVKPRATNHSWGYFKCYIHECDCSRGTFNDLIKHMKKNIRV